ncbi:serine hydrolase domain-containing protein [Geminisphaera colitermitum]|uniref:serine hydrolase domain-containing protein n=1 Tax=Geminisphaera colitermitum TaxID=1148786 RepID=UPI0001964DA9|nr:serine hydrolase domain-containing protein [Geminisphaera colitermitum]
MPDAQAQIQKQLDQLINEDRECGLQVAAYHKGKLIIDACAGHTDASRNTPVNARTLFPLFSCGKGATATIVHRLVARGILDYDRPIATWWPEFAANGKHAITLRHALDHTAGLPYLPPETDLTKLCDWDAMCSAIARLAPAWTPGTRSEYHAITFGWIVGETACRATKLSFQQLLKQEILTPLGLRDFFIGLPETEEARVAQLENATPLAPLPPPPPLGQLEAIPHWLFPLSHWMNRPDIHRACIPASNGIMTARDLARHYAALIPGGVDGVELLPPTSLRRILESNTEGHGFGYARGRADSAMGSARPTCFGHGGHGGSLGFADPDHHLSVAFACNRLHTSDSGESRRKIIKTIRQILHAED